MRYSLQLSFCAAAMLAGVGLASAQQSPPPQADQQRQAEKAVNSASGKAGAEEPSSHAPTAAPASPGAFVDGALAVPGAPADTQTAPAKFSERNAELDKIPMMALPLSLSEEQKHMIAGSVARQGARVAQIKAKPGDVLPSSVELFDLPREVTAAIPMVQNDKYVRLPDRILLVRAPNMIVTGEIVN